MRFLDLTLSTPAENLALDEALLLEAEAGHGGERLRLWEWPRPAVVLGAGCRLAEEVEEEACRAEAVPILRRSSGGGTVLLGSGCLCCSLVLALDRSAALREVRPSYGFILGRICDALSDTLPGIALAGVSDLTIDGRKFSGNAQQRKRRFLLHHGTLLHGFDLSRIARYLRPPPRQPDYRAARPHRDFLMNLPLAGPDLCRRLRSVWQAGDESGHWPSDLVRHLVEEKYDTKEWTHRR